MEFKSCPIFSFATAEQGHILSPLRRPSPIVHLFSVFCPSMKLIFSKTVNEINAKFSGRTYW